MKKHDKFAVVVSRFNENITEKLLSGALREFEHQHIPQDKLTVIHVPGAVEIPLTAKLLAKTGRYQAIVCLGAVIRGETGHYDFVCQQVSDGCLKVMLEFEIPIIFGVLTTDNMKQAEARAGGSVKDMGKDAVEAALTMVAIQTSITTDH